MVITGNVIRALERVKADWSTASMLVEESGIEKLKDLLQPCTQGNALSNDFNLEDEFRVQYQMVKNALTRIGAIETEEDLKILKEAKSFLQFIMKQEEKLADIRAVQQFKEAVLDVLDEVDPEIQDKVLRGINEKLIS
jgi:hypothetical protein